MDTFGFWSFAVEAALFTVLAALIVLNWHGGAVASVLLLAVGISAVWGGVLAGLQWVGVPRAEWLYTLEIARSLAWVFFGLAVAVSGKRIIGKNFQGWIFGLVAISIASVVFGITIITGEETSKPLLVLQLAVYLVGAVLVEQIYRNTPEQSRYQIRHLAVGLGAIFVCDIYAYTQALLFGAIPKVVWDARGVVGAMAAPLLAVSAARNPLWDMPVYVSRPAVFYSTVITTSGIYLLMVAGIGYAIRRYGAEWSGSLQVVFLIVTGTVLALALLSEKVKRRLTLLLSRHFYRAKYDYRSEWIGLTKTLYGANVIGDYERAVYAVAKIIGSDGGVLMLRNGTAFIEVGEWNRGAMRVDGERWPPEFVRYLERNPAIVERHHINEMAKRGIPIPKCLLAEEWLLLPMCQEASLIGCLLLHMPSGVALNCEDYELLATTSYQVAGFIAERESNRKLLESSRFESYYRFSAFVMHDLNNVITQLRLMLSNANKHRHAQGFVDDMLETVDNATQKMQRLLERLRNPDPSTEQVQRTSLAEIARKAAGDNAHREPLPVVEIRNATAAVMVVPETMVMVIGHLVRNAQEATDRQGSVKLVVDGDETWGIVRVVDSGIGMDARFIKERLFRPFDSTKGAGGMGLGAFQAQQFAKQYGGTLTVVSEPGGGTCVEVALPLARSGSKGDGVMGLGETRYGEEKAVGC